MISGEILPPAARAWVHQITFDPALKRWAIFISSASRTTESASQTL
jgi:hypothetical protein